MNSVFTPRHKYGHGHVHLNLSFFLVDSKASAVFQQPWAVLGSGSGGGGAQWASVGGASLEKQIQKKKKKMEPTPKCSDMDPLYALLINAPQAPSLPAS